MKIIKNLDLHSHSICSDGTLSPTELMRLAAKCGLDAVSLTDHDNFNGVEEAREEATKLGIGFLVGIEMSSIFTDGTMHILGYDFDLKNQNLITMLDKFLSYRDTRNKLIIKKLQELGYDVTYEGLINFVGSSTTSIGRPHIANFLINKGLARNHIEVFNNLLGSNKPAYACKECFESKEIISTINAAGGMAFIAHPVTLNLPMEELRELLIDLKAHKLSGIEVINSCQDKNYTNKLISLADELGLLISSGSDFHGLKKKNVNLGKSSSGARITTESISKELLERIR